jgi:DNA polymerase alpha subunit A
LADRVSAQIEDTTPIETKPCIATTFVRPLEKFPKDFEAQARQSQRSKMNAVPGERFMLNQFLGQYEPIIGLNVN